jgi:two-component system sensor histidine kinase AlgZ
MTTRQALALKALIIVAGWTLMAAVWTPPTVAMQLIEHVSSAQQGLAAIFLYVLVGFLPWMALTPLLLRLSQSFAITEQSVLVPLLVLSVLSLVVTPLAVTTGYGLNTLLSGDFARQDLTRLAGAIYITSFYSLPFYIAVIAIGQAMAYFERARVRERHLARAELKALQAQIQPHFLFNTLNAISAVGYRDAARADAALAQLSQLLRTVLTERPEQIPLKDELVFVQDYLDLYTLLMPEKLSISLEIAPQAWQALIPSLLLQPVVENAILHGIARRREAGLVRIFADVRGSELIIAISNDVSEDRDRGSGTGLGLANVRERLKALYGSAQQLDFDPGPPACTRLRLPLRHGQGSA